MEFDVVTQNYELSVGQLEILSLRTSNCMHRPILLLHFDGYSLFRHCWFPSFVHDLCIVTVGPILLRVDSGTRVPV